MAPGIEVEKVLALTLAINEPGKQPMKVRFKDLANFGSSKERATALWKYAPHRALPHGQTKRGVVAEHIRSWRRIGLMKTKFVAAALKMFW